MRQGEGDAIMSVFAAMDIRLDTNGADYAILADLLRRGARHRLRGQALHQDQPGLLPVRPLAAGVGHRPGVHLGQPRRARAARHGGQRRPVRHLRRVHYYWVGAIPAMVFLGLVMMPFYYGTKVRSVPEYLRLRFNKPTHLFNAMTFAIASVLIAGVNLYALALVMKMLLGWPFIARDRRRRVRRARLHDARRPVRGDLQRGAPVLRDRRGPGAADGRRPARRSAAGTA